MRAALPPRAGRPLADDLAIQSRRPSASATVVRAPHAPALGAGVDHLAIQRICRQAAHIVIGQYPFERPPAVRGALGPGQPASSGGGKPLCLHLRLPLVVCEPPCPQPEPSHTNSLHRQVSRRHEASVTIRAGTICPLPNESGNNPSPPATWPPPPPPGSSPGMVGPGPGLLLHLLPLLGAQRDSDSFRPLAHRLVADL